MDAIINKPSIATSPSRTRADNAAPVVCTVCQVALEVGRPLIWPQHVRHRLCPEHLRALCVVMSDGTRSRFCDKCRRACTIATTSTPRPTRPSYATHHHQCSKFHELAEFDAKKHTCKRKLAEHNERARQRYAASKKLVVPQPSQLPRGTALDAVTVIATTTTPPQSHEIIDPPSPRTHCHHIATALANPTHPAAAPPALGATADKAAAAQASWRGHPPSETRKPLQQQPAASSHSAGGAADIRSTAVGGGGRPLPPPPRLPAAPASHPAAQGPAAREPSPAEVVAMEAAAGLQKLSQAALPLVL